MKELKTTNNQYILLDNDDYEFLKKFKWELKTKGTSSYVRTRIHTHDIYIQDLVVGTKPGSYVYHKNGNVLDNRKENLDHIPNHYRSHLKRSNKNKYIGVSKHTASKGYYAAISKEGKRYWLGTYKTPEEAAQAYNIKAKELYGEYALQNTLRYNKT